MKNWPHLLFDAYFVENLKLADHEVLIEVGLHAGLSEEEMKEVLNSDLYNAKLMKMKTSHFQEEFMRCRSILLDGKYSIPGALSYEDFKSVLSQIIAENEVDDDKDADNCADGVCSYMKLRWLGHSAFELISKNGLNILVDPFIQANPAVPLKICDMHPDVICITHGHADHFGDVVEIARNNPNFMVIS